MPSEWLWDRWKKQAQTEVVSLKEFKNYAENLLIFEAFPALKGEASR